MTVIHTHDEIKELIESASVHELINCIEQSFIHYSNKTAVVPPVGTLHFDAPPGDVHIKYGYIQNEDHYVIKIASGFYDNPTIGLPSSNGMNLVFNQRTGELEAILMDKGLLTDVRTAIAGSVAARHFGPTKVQAIGIMGTGTQARLQLRYLSEIIPCKQVYVWGRSQEKLDEFVSDFASSDLELHPTLSEMDIAKNCNLIVTTTPARTPILSAQSLLPNTLITAVGADTPGKQELDNSIVIAADHIIVDSFDQCTEHGEIHTAYKKGLLAEDRIQELGSFLTSGKKTASNLTIVDLTGIATQDMLISRFVLDRL